MSAEAGLEAANLAEQAMPPVERECSADLSWNSPENDDFMPQRDPRESKEENLVVSEANKSPPASPPRPPSSPKTSRKRAPSSSSERPWSTRKEKGQATKILQNIVDVTHVVGTKQAQIMSKYGIYTKHQLSTALAVWMSAEGARSSVRPPSENIQEWYEALTKYNQRSPRATESSAEPAVSFSLVDSPLLELFPASMRNFFSSLRASSRLDGDGDIDKPTRDGYVRRPCINTVMDFLSTRRTETSALCDMVRQWRIASGLSLLSHASISKYLTRLMVRLQKALTLTIHDDAEKHRWIYGSLVVLTGAAHEFVVEHADLAQGEAFLREQTSRLALALVSWRASQGLPPLKGSGPVATISSWKAFVRDAVELELQAGKVLTDVDLHAIQAVETKVTRPVVVKYSSSSVDSGGASKASVIKRRRKAIVQAAIDDESAKDGSDGTVERNDIVLPPKSGVTLKPLPIPSISLSNEESLSLFHAVIWPILLKYHWCMMLKAETSDSTGPESSQTTPIPIYCCPKMKVGEPESFPCAIFLTDRAEQRNEIAHELGFSDPVHKSVKRVITGSLPIPSSISNTSTWTRFSRDLHALVSRQSDGKGGPKPRADSNATMSQVPVFVAELYRLITQIMTATDQFNHNSPAQWVALSLLVPSLCRDAGLSPPIAADINDCVRAMVSSFVKQVSIAPSGDTAAGEEYVYGPTGMDRLAERLRKRPSSEGIALPSLYDKTVTAKVAQRNHSPLGDPSDKFERYQKFQNHEKVVAYLSTSKDWRNKLPVTQALAKYHQFLYFYDQLDKSNAGPKHPSMQWLLAKVQL